MAISQTGVMARREAVCARCRLLQDLGSQCRSCGENALVPLAGATKQLVAAGLLVERPHDVKIVRSDSERAGSLVKGVLLPSVLTSGVTFLLVSALAGPRVALGAAVCVLTLLVLLGISSLEFNLWALGVRLVLGRKLQFTSIDPHGGRPSSPLCRRRGNAHSLGPPQQAHLGSEPCLAASLVIRPKGSGRRYVRATRFTEFLVRTEDGDSYLVTGEVRLEGAAAEHRCAAASELGPLLAALQVPAHEMPAAVAEELVLREGAVVEVLGTETAEARAELAGSFRDGGLIPTLRGAPGNPTIVSILR